MWTFLGNPCVTLPGCKGPNGLPVGVQLVGALGADDELLAVAAWAESRIA
jgi:Asp-tRNA(Asn)/Glu-tRNA(Gln) amidotransferase A subunit family amidase